MEKIISSIETYTGRVTIPPRNIIHRHIPEKGTLKNSYNFFFKLPAFSNLRIRWSFKENQNRVKHLMVYSLYSPL